MMHKYMSLSNWYIKIRCLLVSPSKKRIRGKYFFLKEKQLHCHCLCLSSHLSYLIPIIKVVHITYKEPHFFFQTLVHGGTHKMHRHVRQHCPWDSRGLRRERTCRHRAVNLESAAEEAGSGMTSGSPWLRECGVRKHTGHTQKTPAEA